MAAAEAEVLLHLQVPAEPAAVAPVLVVLPVPAAGLMDSPTRAAAVVVVLTDPLQLQHREVLADPGSSSSATP